MAGTGVGCGCVILAFSLTGLLATSSRSGEAPAESKVLPGVTAVLGLPDGAGADAVVDLAKVDSQTVYFQSSLAEEVAAVREAAAKAGLLGRAIFADRRRVEHGALGGQSGRPRACFGGSSSSSRT